MFSRKLPIGIQDFASLREDGYLYVDKTDQVWRLVQEGRVYFLARPRRFGKSLLLSTLAAYLEGRRELFAGLAIEQLETAWKRHPVLRLDLNAQKYTSVEELSNILGDHLARWEQAYGTGGGPDLALRFRSVIERAHVATGQRVAVLVDEYDKPLLQSLDNPTLHAQYKLLLKAFYGVLKSADEHLKFALLTGVTKFGQVSVFSDLNQLIDLSLHPDYATLCGITELELQRDFGPELEALAKANGYDAETCLKEVRRWYNGYRFHPQALGVYNPFSTLNLFSRREFDAFWFATGTPTFLVELLKKSDYDLCNLDGVTLPAEDFANYQAEADRPLPVIYQSGYLTIKNYDRELRMYTLVFPNAEVRYGFLRFLLPDYLYGDPRESGVNIAWFSKDVKEAII
jgi:hypothetical protein